MPGQRLPYSGGIYWDNVFRIAVVYAWTTFAVQWWNMPDTVCRTVVVYAGTTFAVQWWNMLGQRLPYSCGTCRDNVYRTVVEHAGATFAVQL